MVDAFKQSAPEGRTSLLETLLDGFLDEKDLKADDLASHLLQLLVLGTEGAAYFAAHLTPSAKVLQQLDAHVQVSNMRIFPTDSQSYSSQDEREPRFIAPSNPLHPCSFYQGTVSAASRAAQTLLRDVPLASFVFHQKLSVFTRVRVLGRQNMVCLRTYSTDVFLFSGHFLRNTLLQACPPRISVSHDPEAAEALCKFVANHRKHSSATTASKDLVNRLLDHFQRKTRRRKRHAAEINTAPEGSSLGAVEEYARAVDAFKQKADASSIYEIIGDR